MIKIMILNKNWGKNSPYKDYYYDEQYVYLYEDK